MLEGKRIAILIGPKFHIEETTIPRDFFLERKAAVDVIGLEPGEVTDKTGSQKLTPDKTIDEVDVESYDALIIPGGGAPEMIRQNETAVQFVRDFWETGKPVAAICHGPQVLISAKVLDGVKLTSYAGIRDDIENAGGKWVDEQVCIDGQLITSRSPKDLPAFNNAILEALTSAFVSDEENDMDVLSALELAISREKAAQEFYEGVAKIIEKENVRNKFKYLATIEETHFDQLSDLYRELSGGKEPVVDPSKGSEIGKHRVSPDISADEAIDLAIRAEEKAYNFYRNAALKAKSKPAKEMFEHLASEELEHKRLFSVDKAASRGGRGHFQWATHFDIPPGMDDMW